MHINEQTQEQDEEVEESCYCDGSMHCTLCRRKFLESKKERENIIADRAEYPDEF